MNPPPPQQHEALAALVQRTILRQPESQDLRTDLTVTVADTLGVHRAGVWIRSRGGERLVARDCFDAEIREHHPGAVMEARDLPTLFQVLESRRVVAVDDAATDPRTRELVARYGEGRAAPPSAVLYAPILLDGMLHGVVSAEHRGGARTWRPDEKTFLLSVAGLVAILDLERERQEQQALLGMASRLSRMGAWKVDLESRDLVWSDEVRALHEVQPDFVPSVDTAIDFYLPEHRDEIRQAFRRCAEEGIPYDLEARIRTARGRTLWIRTIGAPVQGGGHRVTQVHGTFQDVTDQRTRDEALRISEERFRLLAGATSDAIWDWDYRTGDVWWSEGVERLFGYLRADIGPSMDAWMAMVHPEDLPAAVEELERCLGSGESFWSSEYRYRHRDGHWLWVQDRGHILRNARGEPIRQIGGISDITRRKELEAQLRQAQQLESVGRLAGGIAHDFNNILTTVVGVAELQLLNPDLPDELREDLQLIKDAGDRAGRLTQQLLAFGRQQILQPRELRLGQVVRELAGILRRITGSAFELHLELTEEDDRILADQGQVEQVLLNLALNARDAMPRGGELRIRVRRSPAGEVELEVSDTGEGMPAHVKDRVFEPFFTTKPVGQGTGLGLATAHGIVEQSGGTIGVESEPGQGTTFRIRLPAYAAS